MLRKNLSPGGAR